MKLLLFILIPFLSFGQIPSEVYHFYVPFGINEVTYSTQRYCFPKQRVGYRLLFSSLVTASACYGKEAYDNNRKNGTGFSFPDLGTGLSSIPVYGEVRICINDYNKPPEIDTAYFNFLKPTE